MFTVKYSFENICDFTPSCAFAPDSWINGIKTERIENKWGIVLQGMFCPFFFFLIIFRSKLPWREFTLKLVFELTCSLCVSQLLFLKICEDTASSKRYVILFLCLLWNTCEIYSNTSLIVLHLNLAHIGICNIVINLNTWHETKVKHHCPVFLHWKLSQNIKALNQKWELRCALVILHNMSAACVIRH